MGSSAAPRTLGARAGRVQTRIAESVAADLRHRILQADFPEGPLPKQDDLIQEYGVSGPSLREALRILEAEGLITVRRGKVGGAYIHPPGWASAAYALGLSLQGQGLTVNDLAGALRTMEPLCVAECAKRDDRADTVVPALEANIEASEQSLGEGADFTAVARNFHDILGDWTPNPTLRLVMRSLVAVWTIQERAWADTMAGEGRYPDLALQNEVLATHRAITRHISRGHAERVQAIVREHLAATQSRVLEIYGDRTVDASSAEAVRGFRSLAPVEK